jgi:Transposase IS200 like
MRRIKGRSAKMLREEFPQLLKLPCMWTPSYFVGSVAAILIMEIVLIFLIARMVGGPILSLIIVLLHGW